ncbi:MAG TPA: phytoene/squalene synthase family protein [Polyangia bacterium]|nr:phytoene/squalene synthase family protein [Polyangia bacterium]
MTTARAALARRILAHHSKSFSMAGRLLPRWCRDDAAALYAWCRRCDDAVDVPTEAAVRSTAVRRLRAELDAVAAGAPQSDPVLAGFEDVTRRHAIPLRHAHELIDGMEMDVGAVRYRTVDELLVYCYRVAGTVGLMMAHVMGVRDAASLRRAADLGMAMQLTNICRDVDEDERRDRVYLPEGLLGDAHASRDRRAASAVRELLLRADVLYRSGDLGLRRLPLRCAFAIRAARLIYADIGRQIARVGFDVRAGRAVVSRGRKLWLVLRAAVGTLAGARA